MPTAPRPVSSGLRTMPLCVLAGAAAAQQPVLVADLNQDTSAYFSQAAGVGGRAVVGVGAGSDPLRTLWITDGTVPGTHALTPPMTLTLGVGGEVVTAGGEVVFAIYEGRERGVWAFDSGVERFTHLWDGRGLFVQAYGGAVFYSGYSPGEPAAAWRYEPGSGLPPARLPDSVPAPINGVVVDGVVYYPATDPVAQDAAIWSYDLTTGASRRLAGPVRPTYGLHAVGRHVCFLHYLNTNQGVGVGRIDTATGAYTVFPAPLAPATPYGFDYSAFGLYLFGGVAADGPQRERRVVMSFDPSTGVFGSYSLPGWGDFRDAVAVGDELYFPFREAANGLELYRLRRDSTAAERVTDINPGPGDGLRLYEVPTLLSGRLWFSADDGVSGRELWVYDPATGEARRVKDVNAGPSGSNPLVRGAAGGVVLFEADDGVHGHELWRTDGTDAGTYLLRDFQIGTNGSSVQGMLAQAGRLLFKAYTDQSRWRLYGYDGTAPPTPLGAPNTSMQYGALAGPVPFRGMAIFGGDRSLPDGRLAITDGTPAGTRTLSASVHLAMCDSHGFSAGAHAEVNGLFIFAGDSDSGCQVWVTDGTDEGTAPLKSAGGLSLAAYEFRGAATFRGRAYFTADDGVHGSELWSTNGADAGTRLVADLEPGPYPSFAGGLTLVGGQLYFLASVHQSTRLYSLDPGIETPALIFAWPPGTPGGIGQLFAAGDVLVFTVETAQGPSLWTYTPATGAFAHAADGELYPAPSHPGDGKSTLVLGQGFFYVDGSDGHTASVRVLDTTTGIVRTLLTTTPARPDLAPRLFTTIRSHILFSADDGDHGSELWITDGTPQGTRLFADLVPGPIGSDPRAAAVMGDRLYLSCSTPAYGQELYYIPLCPADFNLDRAVDVDDLLAFLAAYSAGSPDADVDNGSGSATPDGGVTVEDLIFFLARYASGC